MLDRAKLFKAMQDVEHELFFDSSEQVNLARKLWQEIINDPVFAHKVRQKGGKVQPPFWYEPLGTIYPVTQTLEEYCAISVDGSQVYPDRHQGTSCFLINVGSVVIHYKEQPSLFLESKPFVFAGQRRDEGIPDLSRDTVNCLRQGRELEAGLKLFTTHQELASTIPTVLLFDGSLIFWHLAAKEAHIKEHYLAQHLHVFNELFKKECLLAGYISLPRSKELITLLRLKLCEFDLSDESALEAFSHVVDATLMYGFLKPYERTIVFQNNAPISNAYPDTLRPYFFYINVGDEIVRIELPAWIAQQQFLVDLVATMVCDQATKGSGYPVVIAEAHEQAVVKGADREFFYSALQHIGMASGRQMTGSQKAAKKRIIGI